MADVVDGAGKTTLLETIAGARDPIADTVDPAVPVRYLRGSCSVVAGPTSRCARCPAGNGSAPRWPRCCWPNRHRNCCCWDEPANNLDLASTRRLAQALAAYRGALLVAGHDLPFLHELGITRWLRLDGDVTQIDPPPAS